MFNLKKFAVAAAAMTLVAGSALASNFRASDQVYVPIAGHQAGGSGTFISDVFLSNLSTDPVTVTVVFVPLGNSSPTTTPQSTFPAITLAAGERKEFIDFFQSQLGLTSGIGQLIFNACKQGADCSPATQDQFGVSPFFRPISVESRIFVIPPGAVLSSNPETKGQALPGFPWYSFVSSDSASVGLDKVFITGLRNTGTVGQAGTYRGNIGLVNASQYSTTTLAVKLFDGKTNTQIGSTVQQTLGPLQNVQVQLSSFSGFSGTTATNAYATVEQVSSTPTSDAPSTCGTGGCPAFFAYGSVLDNSSSDATTLEPQFLKPLTDAAIGCIFNPTTSCKASTGFRRAAKH